MNRIEIKTLLLLSLILIFWTRANGQSDYKLAEQDSLALVAFYHATDGPNWTSNQDGFGFDDLSADWQVQYDGGYNKWLDGPVKDWFGVKVEKRAITNSSDSVYRVTWIWPVIGRRTDGQNLLSGYLTRELGLMTALEQLRVNGNNGFEWTEIPDDIFHSSLNYLDIESAWFGGEISDVFRNCVDVRKMNFRYNYIDYMPTLDFLDEEDLYAMNGTQWFYSTRLSYAMAEKNIDHFYTISDNPKEFGVEYRDLFDVGDEQEFLAALGSQVVMECISAGEHEEFITYQWFKNGLSLFGKTDRTLTIASVTESDYADYTVKISNEYVKEYDQNSNYGEVFTKEKHLVAAPVPPVVEWAKTSYNGKEIVLRFSKPMDNGAAGYDGFSIQAGSRTLSATSARTQGRLDRDYVLTLNEPVIVDELVSLEYSGSSLVDKNGGILASLSDSTVMNLVRAEPVLLSAKTTKNGRGVEVWFDNYIDQAFINPDDFTLIRTGNASIAAATLLPGELDSHISKGVLLTLSEAVTDSTEVISVQYQEGELSGLYSGVVLTSPLTEVINDVSLVFTKVLLTFEDGSKSLENILIEPSWQLDPVQMFDDGSHGDTLAGDFNWANSVSLVDDSYTWDVIARKSVMEYDTLWTEDPETGVVTVLLTPNEIHKDSLLSEDVLLDFVVFEEQVSGTTSFGIQNINVSFNLSLGHASNEIFLMGIEEDWGLGIPMEVQDGSFIYDALVPGYTRGDIITYNYREGNVWENQTAEPRSYVVQATDNVINDVFGVFTALPEEVLGKQVKLFPNPVRDHLYISGLDHPCSIEIYNTSGQLMTSLEPNFDAVSQCDVSGYISGIYVVKLHNNQNTKLYLKFIKY